MFDRVIILVYNYPMETLTKVDKTVNDALNQWALSVFQRIEKEHPELLESLLNDNDSLNKKEAHLLSNNDLLNNSDLLNKNKEAHRD